MRTSRVSRETARLVSALSTTRTTRSSLRAFEHASKGSVKDEPNGLEADDDDSKPSTASANDAPSKSRSQSSISLGKRKREPADSPTTVRKSSRKADSAPRKPRRQPAKHIKGPNGTITAVEPPANWEQVYNTTFAMRKRVLAPVDTMGCESLAEEHRSPRDRRLQTLIALMLSSQTKDTVTAVAMKNLQDNLPGGFNLEALLEVEPEELNELIGKVGFHNNKTKFIKSVATILSSQYDGDIPDTIDGLISLPGVGPKMAYLCMSAAWGRDEGIGVDVHVHRITNLWGWHKTSTPEQTRAELEAWLPMEKWHEINWLLVGLGQTICLPVGRKCGDCDLATQGLCPGAVPASKRSPVKRLKNELHFKSEGEGEDVKGEIEVQADDVGIKIEAKTEKQGEIEMSAVHGVVHDIKSSGYD